MAKWCGVIGFAEYKETSPGVWEDVITERNYYGEVIRSTRRNQTADQLNDHINVANEISILADPFANDNFHSMRYIAYRGAKWKISSVEIRYPRLILTTGGLYNGEQA